ncbi:TetR/AcrR family transcriptional regulator [Nocardia sp. NPDC049149]|uniref:TetR/AcrR family transcriptional regulator n=1 Tax=Nocardia sp. NPDC049149 TaxID=3364315 RepID=UPI00371CEC97
MRRDTRNQMIRQAAFLFRGRGYGATGIREIAQQAGAHRGVMYHHFPRGKTEVAEEVLAATDAAVGSYIESWCANQEPIPAMRAIIAGTKMMMAMGEHPPGSPVAAVALGAGPDDQTLRDTADAIYRRWQRAFRDCLRRNGTPDPDAANLATLLIAGIEGALVLCRAEGNNTPLDRLAAALEITLRSH